VTSCVISSSLWPHKAGAGFHYPFVFYTVLTTPSASKELSFNRDSVIKALLAELERLKGESVHLEEEMTKIRMVHEAPAEQAGKFAAIPSDFKLSYGSTEEFGFGLNALVGPPVANASQLENAVKDEHQADPEFQIWSNQFKKLYAVSPLEEYNYCQGFARAGGHEQYRQAISPNQDHHRDAGQDGMSVEAFLQSYLDSLVNLMGAIHKGNLKLQTSSCELSSAWEIIQATNKSLSAKVACSQEYDSGYKEMKLHLLSYNYIVTMSPNQDLQLLVVNELQRLEVVCIRLYSGPMFKRYNDTARWRTKGVYSTTIALTSSAQIKLSKITKACKVFRGICGGQLPDSFYTPNVFNVKGGIERAFMSTTTVLAVAADFAASQGEGKIGVVYEMDMGMIDRGADLSMMSQYPHEKEILFAPLTGLEVQGTVRKGSVLHITTRLNTNLKAQTIEEMQSKMKSVHINLIDILKENLEGVGIVELGALQQHRLEAEQTPELAFNEPEFYLKMTTKGLNCKQDICLAVLQSDAASGEQFVVAAKLLTSSRHFADALCALDDEKSSMLAKNANIQAIAFRNFSSIDAGVISKVSLAFMNSAVGMSLDLTGDVMTNEIKEMTGRMLLDCAVVNVASIRTDYFTLNSDVTELQLANSRLQVSDAALLAGCISLFTNSLQVLNISGNRSMAPRGIPYLAQAIAAHTALTILNIADCDLKVDGIRHIAKSLENNT
jgi:hypothetical protein